MPSPKAVVYHIAQGLGASILDDEWEILVDAPKGKQWVDGSCLQLVASPWLVDGKWTSRLVLWRDLMERMKCGLEDCDEE